MDGSFFVPAVVKFHGPSPADIGVCSIDKKSIAGPRLPPGEDNTRDTTQPTSYRRHVLPDEVSTVHRVRPDGNNELWEGKGRVESRRLSQEACVY